MNPSNTTNSTRPVEPERLSPGISTQASAAPVSTNGLSGQSAPVSTQASTEPVSSQASAAPQSVSLLITTYNWPEALQMAARSAFSQSVLPTELIIADDGSKEPTRQAVERLKAQSPVPVIHVWQPDEGFQAARIRNRGIAAASSDYIICIDGDVILDRYFIEDHLKYAEAGCCVCGKRAKLTSKASARILTAGEFVQPRFWNADVKFGYNFYAVRSRWLCARTLYYIRDFQLRPRVMSCNMAFWKADAIAVNGFDEAYTTWGLEDRDFSLRLRHAGIALKCIRFAANQFHLFHPSDAKTAIVNSEQYEQCAAQKRIKAEKGIDQFL